MKRSDLPVDNILEALDLSRAEPGIGFLQALSSRFNARVPFETVSKILRNADVADPAEKPRRPELFWSEHLELGTGGTCFARVAAFDALLRSLGFHSRKVLGRVEHDFDHASLLVELDNGLSICDVGFPLPILLPAHPARVGAPLADLEVSATASGFRIEIDGGVPEGPRSLEIFGAEVSDEKFDARWRETFDPRSRFLSQVLLRLELESRVVSYARGQIRVDDRHSRATIPILPPRADRLAEIFAIERDVIAKAIELAGEPTASTDGGRLTSYLETSATVQDAYAAIADLTGYRKLLNGVAQIVEEELTAEGWKISLAPPAEAAALNDRGLREDVSTDPARHALCVRRQSDTSFFESELRVEERNGKTHLIREALFTEPREDFLRNDSLRGRLAGALAVDLLAWARLIR